MMTLMVRFLSFSGFSLGVLGFFLPRSFVTERPSHPSFRYLSVESNLNETGTRRAIRIPKEIARRVI